MSEKRKYNETRVTAVICALLGMLSFVAIYGVAVLDFTYVDWLLPVGQKELDRTQHYLGWVTYRNSAWHFPLGLMDGVNYPHLISVIYMDALPLFSFIFKILSPFLPENFQFFGLFGFLCFALQGYFSGLLLYKCTRDKTYTVVASLFLILSNIMILRLYWHTGLAAHWIILAAYAVWMYQEKFEKFWKKALVWSVLTAVALLIQVYLVPMVWGIMICCQLQDCMKRKKYVESFSVFFASAVSFVIIGWMFGLFYGDVMPDGSGLGLHSFNLNGFFNTFSDQYHTFLKPLDVIDIRQVDGYSYLGLGILIFALVLCITAALQCTGRTKIFLQRMLKNKRFIVPIGLLFIGFVGFAVSPFVSFGSHYFALPIGDSIYKIWSIFRSSGRMIWPIWYLLVIAVPVGWYLLMRKKKAVLYGVTALLLVVQIVDCMPLIRLMSSVTQPGWEYQEETLTSPAWEEIGEKYTHMMLYPETDQYMYWNATPYYFHLYALKYDLTMNTTYFSRNISETVDEETYEIFAQAKETGKWDADTFYICKDKLPEYSEGLYSYVIDGLVVYLPKPLELEYENCYYVENAYEKMMEHNKAVE